MFKTLRHLAAVFGLLVVLAIAYGAFRYYPLWSVVAGFDPKAVSTYLTLAKRLAETGDVAEASVWRLPVEPGLSPEDVEATIKYAAAEYNLAPIRVLPLSNQIEAMRNTPYRRVTVYTLCKPVLAARLVNRRPAYAAHLPCRLSLVESPNGRLWLYTLNLDLIIHGGEALPANLRAELLHLKKAIRDIMGRGAEGRY